MSEKCKHTDWYDFQVTDIELDDPDDPSHGQYSTQIEIDCRCGVCDQYATRRGLVVWEEWDIEEDEEDEEEDEEWT